MSGVVSSETRCCKRCHQEKPVSLFHHHGRVLGKIATCKECTYKRRRKKRKVQRTSIATLTVLDKELLPEKPFTVTAEFKAYIDSHYEELKEIARQLTYSRLQGKLTFTYWDVLHTGILDMYTAKRVPPAEREQFLPWANVIMLNVCNRMLRKHKQQRLAADGFTLEVSLQAIQDPLPVYLERLTIALSSLRPKDRQVLEVGMQATSGKEMAAALGLKEETARTQYYTARRSLMKLLKITPV